MINSKQLVHYFRNSSKYDQRDKEIMLLFRFVTPSYDDDDDDTGGDGITMVMMMVFVVGRCSWIWWIQLNEVWRSCWMWLKWKMILYGWSELKKHVEHSDMCNQIYSGNLANSIKSNVAAINL